MREAHMSIPIAAGVVLAITSATCAARSDDASTEGARDHARAVSIPIAAWNGGTRWQELEGIPGKWLAWPGAGAAGALEIDGCGIVTTGFGVMREEKDAWRIIPQLATRQLSGRPFVVDGLLWITEVTATQEMWLLALEPDNWRAKRSIALPRGAAVIAVESNGIWCLQQAVRGLGRGGFRGGHKRLLQLDLKGEEQLRFEAGAAVAEVELPRAIRKDVPHAAPNPAIQHAFVDEDAVWLAITDHRGIMPNDAPIRGPFQIARVDRKTKQTKCVVVEDWWGTLVLNRPGELLWLTAKRGPEAIVVRFDKATWKTTHVSIDARMTYSYGIEDDYLWLSTEPLRVFGLSDLKPAERAAREKVTAAVEGRLGWTTAVPRMLCGDRRSVWFALPGLRVARLADDGSTQWRELGDVLADPQSYPQATTAGHDLFIYSRGTLIRLPLGDGKATVRQVGPRERFAARMVANGEYVTVAFHGRPGIYVFDHALALVRQILRPDDARFDPRLLDLIDGHLYYQTGRGGRMMAMHVASGESRPLASWHDAATAHLKQVLGDQIDQSWYERLLASAMVSGDARQIRLQTWAATSPYRGSRPRVLMFYYDVKQDKWSHEVLDADSWPMQRQPDLFFDTKRNMLLRYDNGWQEAGRLPQHWLLAGLTGWPAHATDKHLYLQTPVGLWRVSWPVLSTSTCATAPNTNAD